MAADAARIRRPSYVDGATNAGAEGAFPQHDPPGADEEHAPAALLRAQRAAADAERRLRLLTSLTRSIASVFEPKQAIEHLTQVAVPAFADWCLVAVIDVEPAMFRLHHRDPRHGPAADALCRYIQQTRNDASAPVQQVHKFGEPTLMARVTEDVLDEQVADEMMRQAYRDFGTRSVIIAPLWARGRVIGNASFVRSESECGAFTHEDTLVAAELAQQTALALDNARLLARERVAAETLQRSLLPELPDIPGLGVAARYMPANNQAQVGGDWYDVLPLPDGDIGLAIGDVMGHDLEAAAAMGQLRSVLRAYAWDGAGPAAALARLDHLVSGLRIGRLATAVYGRMRLSRAGGGRFEYANAGHPAPVLRLRDGTTELLEGAHAPMIGLPGVFERTQAAVDVPAGATLVLYTDGLVESRSQPAEEGVAQLRRVLESAPADGSLEDLCDLVLDQLRPDRRLADDIALLVLRPDRP
jgi:serine phosphatase RsbU (regulator of sigma subunit)